MGEQHTPDLSQPSTAVISLALSLLSEHLFQCILKEFGCGCSEALELCHTQGSCRDVFILFLSWMPQTWKYEEFRTWETLCSAQDSEPAQGSLF